MKVVTILIPSFHGLRYERLGPFGMETRKQNEKQAKASSTNREVRLHP